MHCLAVVEALSSGYLWEEKDTFPHSHTEARNEKWGHELGNTRILYLTTTWMHFPWGNVLWGNADAVHFP